MKCFKLIYFIILLVLKIYPDCDFIDYTIKVKVFFNNGSIQEGYTNYNPDNFYLSPDNLHQKLNKKNDVLYTNKIGTDMLMLSDSIYVISKIDSSIRNEETNEIFPMTFKYLVGNSIPILKIKHIEIIEPKSKWLYSADLQWVNGKLAEFYRNEDLNFIVSFPPKSEEDEFLDIVIVSFDNSVTLAEFKVIMEKSSDIADLESKLNKNLYHFYTYSSPCGC